jgi:apolipoprotein N-acyltransferase
MKDETGGADAAPRVSLSHHPASFLLSFALGAISVAGFAPLAWYPVPIFALAAMMLVWQSATSKKIAGLHGYSFGLGFFLFGVSWVYVSLADFGGMPLPLAALATLLFCMILSLYPAAVGYLQQSLGGAFAARALLSIPALWTIAEWLRDVVTGFPWLAIGYAEIPSGPFVALAPMIGVFGVSLASAIAAGMLAIVVEQLVVAKRGVVRTPWQFRRAATAVVALLLSCAGGFALRDVSWTAPAGPPLTVALLQGNIAQDLKFDEDWYDRTLTNYRRLAYGSDARLIVWPETAIPRLLDQVDPGFLLGLKKHAAENNADMLIGIPYRDAEGNYFNNVFSFGASPTQFYSKSHLVPFGEFFPAGFHWVLGMLHIPLGDFTRGPEDPQPLAVAGQRVAVDICYEDAFGEEIIRQLPQSTVLVNVSNVAWFGHSIAPEQHLQMSQMRALETGRPMLRATNTGMTAAIDAQGYLEKALPQFTEGALVATIQPHTGATPFVRWGNTPAVLLSAILLGIAVLRARNRL